MRKNLRKRTTGQAAFSVALNRLEEALQLLRQTPMTALLIYWVATGAFAGACVYFWADMSRSAFAWKRCPVLAAGLALLYPVMKTMQAYFCAWLSATRQNSPPPAFRAGTFARVLCSQVWWQSAGFILLPAAAVVTLPFGWTMAFLQNLTVLAWGSAEKKKSPVKTALRQSFLTPREHHFALFILSVCGQIVFVDFIVLIIFLPGLAKSILGLETVFTIGASHLFNSTLLACAAALTYLVIDMFMKAYYVIRCFHGNARKTGDDILVDLRRFRLSPALKIILAGCLFIAGSAGGKATGHRAHQNELNQAIEKVIESPRYTWRSPRDQLLPEDHFSYGWFQAIGQWVKSCFQAVGDMLERLEAFLNRLFKGKDYSGHRPFRLFGTFTPGKLILWIGVIILVLCIGRLLWRRSGAKKQPVDTAAPAPRAAVDLTAEDVSAEDMEEDEWFHLASEMLSAGECRLALRALFLGAVAGLGRRRLIRVKRYKSNRDYLRELQRKEAYCSEDLRDFSEVANIFEQVWYGTRSADDTLYDHVNRPARRLARERPLSS